MSTQSLPRLARCGWLPRVGWVMLDLNPGDVVADKYRVERILGRGGMGVVVAATHLQLSQKVALKFLMPEALRAEGGIERFLREARAVVQFRGEHVARVMDVGTVESGAPFIVMEYLEGSDLSAVLHARGPLPCSEAVDYVLQTCEALAEAHRLGIVHRDLKPANLFLTRRPDGSALVKVLDFGISKILGTQNLEASAGITGASSVIGSPHYMSPEQIMSSRDVDHRTDIWSLGIILHELLAGNPPFRADTAPALMVAIAVAVPPLLRSERKDAPAELEAVITRCLSKHREQRFSNVAVLAQALAPFATPGGKSAVERVARVLGVGVEASPAEPAVPGAGALASAGEAGGTLDAWGNTGEGATRRRWGRFGVVGVGIVAVSGALFAVLRLSERSDSAPPVASGFMLGTPSAGAVVGGVSSAPSQPGISQAPEAAAVASAPAVSVLPTPIEPQTLRQRSTGKATSRHKAAPVRSNPEPSARPKASAPGASAGAWREVFDDLD